MIGGNALGDGSEKKNRTDDKHEESFHEKYKKELKKGIDELGLDEDGEINIDFGEEFNETNSGMGESENVETEDPILDFDAMYPDEPDEEEVAPAAEGGEEEPAEPAPE